MKCEGQMVSFLSVAPREVPHLFPGAPSFPNLSAPSNLPKGLVSEKGEEYVLLDFPI